MKCDKDLNGAYEEPYVIGSRIEIDGSKIIILWRASPVLETSFKIVEEDGRTELKLKNTGLRYRGDVKDYGEIKSIIVNDGRLEVTELFPITGESRATLEKTDRSRFGNFTIEDGLLKELEGEWRCSCDTMPLKFSGNEMTLGGEKHKVHILRSKSDGSLFVADVDPAVEEWRGISRFEYTGDRLVGRMMVCDAPSIILEYTKIK